jgi:iron complex outermembrane receptor protein
VKYEHGTFMTTLALFQIEKPSGEIGAGNVFRYKPNNATAGSS